MQETWGPEPVVHSLAGVEYNMNAAYMLSGRGERKCLPKRMQRCVSDVNKPVRDMLLMRFLNNSATCRLLPDDKKCRLLSVISLNSPGHLLVRWFDRKVLQTRDNFFKAAGIRSCLLHYNFNLSSTNPAYMSTAPPDMGGGRVDRKMLGEG